MNQKHWNVLRSLRNSLYWYLLDVVRVVKEVDKKEKEDVDDGASDAASVLVIKKKW